MSGRRVRVAGAVAVTALLLVLLARRVSLAHVASLVLGAPPLLLLAACAAAAGFQAARVLRYRALLSQPGRVGAGGGRARDGMLPLAAASMSAWALSLALPGVVGDALLVVLLRRACRVPLVRGAGVALVARAFDVASLALIPLLVAPLAGVRLPAPALVAFAAVAGVMAISLGALLWPSTRGRLIEVASMIPRAGRLAVRLEEELAGLDVGRTTSAVAATTLAARLFSAFEYMALFAAVGMPLSFWQASFTVSARTLLLAIPVQGVAGLGTTQLWWTAGLLLLGWHLSTALAASLAVHLLDLAVSLPIAVAGLGLLAWVTGAGVRAGRRPALSAPAAVEAGGD